MTALSLTSHAKRLLYSDSIGPRGNDSGIATMSDGLRPRRCLQDEFIAGTHSDLEPPLDPVSDPWVAGWDPLTVAALKKVVAFATARLAPHPSSSASGVKAATKEKRAASNELESSL